MNSEIHTCADVRKETRPRRPDKQLYVPRAKRESQPNTAAVAAAPDLGVPSTKADNHGVTLVRNAAPSTTGGVSDGADKTNIPAGAPAPQTKTKKVSGSKLRRKRKDGLEKKRKDVPGSERSAVKDASGSKPRCDSEGDRESRTCATTIPEIQPLGLQECAVQPPVPQKTLDSLEKNPVERRAWQLDDDPLEKSNPTEPAANHCLQTVPAREATTLPKPAGKCKSVSTSGNVSEGPIPESGVAAEKKTKESPGQKSPQDMGKKVETTDVHSQHDPPEMTSALSQAPVPAQTGAHPTLHVKTLPEKGTSERPAQSHDNADVAHHNESHEVEKTSDDDVADTWETIYSDDGKLLNTELMKELTEAVGEVKIESTKLDYTKYQLRDPQINEDEFSHVIEIYGFPSEFKTLDLMTAFSQFKDQGFDIKWVDDTHALGLFSSPMAAANALDVTHPMLKTRPLREASRDSKLKAKRCAEFLQPYRPRPETSASLARRLVVGALGLQVRIPKEQREKERQKLKEAKEKKRLAAKQKNDMWEGIVDSSPSSAKVS